MNETQNNSVVVKKMYLLPNDQVNLAARAQTIASNWNNMYPNVVFDFLSRQDFAQLASNYETSVNAKRLLLTQRKDITNTLKELSSEGKKHAGALKKYISLRHEGTHKQTAMSLYGLVSINKTNLYSLPQDRDKSLAALGVLVAKLSEADNPIAAEKYGLTYWQEYQTKLKDNWTKAQNIDSQLAGLTNTINALQGSLKEKIVGIRFALRAGNPKTYRTIWREWGFQTEKN